MNHFITPETAERYARGRPYFHELVMDRISERLQLTAKLEAALDVACGTGLSSLALRKIARRIVGTDASEAMLAQAQKLVKLEFILAQAERIPLADSQFDLITVSSGLHWFDIDAFLREASRLLQPNGWLVEYNNFFYGQMQGNVDFGDWVQTQYLECFPSPPRKHTYDWSPQNLARLGFHHFSEETFDNTVSFSLAELSLYFTTQSNIAAAIATGQHSYASVEAWLHDQLQPFFPKHPKREFMFGTRMRSLQKIHPSGEGLP
ncbi:MAG: methyltransferase domain-containing protein [Bacteroidota bacterium]